MPLPSRPAPLLPGRGRLRPLGLDEVRLTGGFWAHRQHVNATATLDHCLAWVRKCGWIDNFRAAAEGRAHRDRRGPVFADSDVYKLLEAMAWEAGRRDDTALDAVVDEVTAVIAGAQTGDGYLNTAFGGPGQAARYSDLEWGHELYCYGHLIQAGIAQARARGEGALTRIAVRAADHVRDVFGPGGIERVCGHPEIETALVELSRLTGDSRYLDQAAFFIDRRGRRSLADIAFGRAYFQDDTPVREAGVLRGHAVRALYLAAGAVDVAVERGDDELLAAVVRQWEATVARRTHLTGGMGSHHMDESFGDDFVLPPDRAYAETCAGVASVMLAQRLLLATGHPRYADLVERTLYNVVAASPADDGRSFFYANTLHQRRRGAEPDAAAQSPRAAAGLRAPWFAVSCCPTNVARTLATLGTCVATRDPDGLQIHQYADADLDTELPRSGRVGVEMRTGYPYDGGITLRVTRATGRPWTLTLRVPAWAHGAHVTEPDGHRRPAAPGTVEVTRTFAPGDEIRLHLPMEPRWTTADRRVDALRGQLAVERGPLVLCLESVDLPDDRDVDAVAVDGTVPPQDAAEGDGSVVVAGRLVDGVTDAPWPYTAPADAPEPRLREAELLLTPYHARASRGPSTMRVWLPATGPART
ncbi:glycoside hydrolase family 127 protein [Streptomyces sp. TRM S81-3]|uniref:Glycoside hydrolase family 127 protein n=1 Tax=Streptomyces griseicoloratus TaxID=2752516 RepID=A0A926QTA3_9ACTN|nr:beta-L-arabinofuranosidase domain-containing protein [Streptomyces griseicoloratus]MBD0421822.1 glycoside hydrolase family 127 protein [Streptomyces griseicoloratus]